MGLQDQLQSALQTAGAAAWDAGATTLQAEAAGLLQQGNPGPYQVPPSQAPAVQQAAAPPTSWYVYAGGAAVVVLVVVLLMRRK